MPRGKAISGTTSGFRQVQRQAQALLMQLHQEIRTKEAELQRLKKEASSLGFLTGRIRAQSADAASSKTRVNWRTVLGQLPKQFKASDIRSIRGLKNKRPSEIFAAITRWIEAGAVKRKTRGVYERV